MSIDWETLDVKSAAEMLARTHVAARKLQKRANPLAGMALPDFAGMASQAGQWLQSMLPRDPAARDIATKALIGAGAGGLGGLGLGVMSDRKKNPLTTALTGALGGGMVGAGLGGLLHGANGIADTSQQIQQQGRQAANAAFNNQGNIPKLVDAVAAKIPGVAAEPAADMPPVSDLLGPAATDAGRELVNVMNPGGIAGAAGGAMTPSMTQLGRFKTIDRAQLKPDGPFSGLKPVVNAIDDAHGGPLGPLQAGARLEHLQRAPGSFMRSHGINLNGITPRAAASQMGQAARTPTLRGRALRGGIGALLGNLIWNATGADDALDNYFSGESAQ